jgi:hypothetical protein
VPLDAGNKSIESIAGFALDALCIGGGGRVFGVSTCGVVRKKNGEPKWKIIS